MTYWFDMNGNECHQSKERCFQACGVSGDSRGLFAPQGLERLQGRLFAVSHFDL